MRGWSIAAMAAQFAALVALALWLSRWFYLALLFRAAGMLLCAYILDSDMNSAYKTMYAVMLNAFPLFGIAIYFLMKIGGRSREPMRAGIVPSETGGYAAAKLGGVCGNAEGAKYLETGKEFFDSLLRDIRHAKKFVLLQFYIVKKGELFNALLSALGGCAGRGVEVKLCCDSFGSFGFERELKSVCEKNKVDFRSFNKVGWVLSGGINRRNHGKCAVIDGRIAYVGGVNIGDEYVGKTVRFGDWKDGGVRFKGGAVNGVTDAFFAAFDFGRRKKADPREYYAQHRPLAGEEFVCSFHTVPTDGESPLAEIFKTAIYNAKRSVTVCTPYLMPDEGVTSALISAAERGVKVRVVIPGIPDKKAVYAVSLTVAEKLKEKGVSVLKYKYGFIHAKNTVIDGKYLLCGSGNLDYRSLYLHYELGIFAKCARLAAQAEENVLSDAAEYAERAEWKGKALKVFAPFM